MLHLKELKGDMIAGSAIPKFDFFIQWHLTERCNLRCAHCYQRPGKKQEMTPGEVVREIDGATGMFRAWEREEGIEVNPSIHFTGGEPFVYRGFLEILEHAAGQGYETAVLTNGALIGGKEAARLHAIGVRDVQVSLEGPPSVHDAIRGKGAFAAAGRGIARLKSAGCHVSANVTLSRLNAGAIAETVSQARDLGIAAIGFSRLVPCGRGGAMLDHLLTARELHCAYEQAQALNGPGLRVISCDPLFGTLSGNSPPPGSPLTLSGCSAGFSGVTVTSAGDVMACRRIGIRAGSLKRKSLREIWSTSRHLWKLRKRESYRGRCGACALWPSCRGCRAVALAWSTAKGRADLFADDPQCWRQASSDGSGDGFGGSGLGS